MPDRLIARLTDGSDYAVVIPDGSSATQMLEKLSGHMKGADWIDVEGPAKIRTAAVIALRIVADS
jgi:hypothetical protein